jgi:hypothetical protein
MVTLEEGGVMDKSFKSRNAFSRMSNVLSVHPARARSITAILICIALAVLSLSQTSFCQADEYWVDSRQIGPFSCWANFPLKRIEPFLAQLNDLQNDLVKHLGISPAEEKIELLLFRNEWSYRNYLRRNYPNAPDRRALFIKRQGPGTVLVYWNENFRTDVRHECTHALLHSNLPMVPLWLDEGLAEYYEMPPEKRAYDNPYSRELKLKLLVSGIQKLEQLERLANWGRMSGVDYRDCWAWVHFMLHGPEDAHDELIKFLKEIEAGNHPGLMSHRLAGRLSEPAGECIAHHRSWKRR